ncbi:MAG: GNAT family N-acetyltransferase [bacterium]
MPGKIAEIKFRQRVEPEDLGKILYQHGLLYSREYGYGLKFAGYVAQSLAEYALLDDFTGSALWLAEKDDQLVGTIAIIRRSDKVAQLRWFLILPDFRGLGLGKILLNKALDFCRQHNYEKVFLWTVEDLHAACHLYEAAGFKPTEAKSHDLWGQMLTEVRYDLG